MIQRGRQERTQIANFLNPVNGYRYPILSLPSIRGNLELHGIKPKDHRKDNKKFISQKQEEFKKKTEELAKPKRIFNPFYVFYS